MAKTTAPFFSLGASGQFASTMVAAKWKGIAYMRKYVVPANPKTAAQVAHRAVWTLAIAAYRDYLTDTDLRSAWRRNAATFPAVMSGFNAAVQALVGMITSDPDTSFAVSASEAVGTCTIVCQNVDDGAQGDEAGDFEVWAGLTPTGMTKVADTAIAAGDIVRIHAFTGGLTYYIKIRKDGFDRSGIFALVSATP